MAGVAAGRIIILLLAAACLLARPDPGRADAASGSASATEPVEGVIYVAPNGRDGWSGRFGDPLPDGTDGPLASLAAARDAARGRAGADTIIVRGGDYHLAAPVELGKSDAALVIKAAKGEAPVFYGGPRVAGWRKDEGGSWSAPVSLPEGAGVGELVVGGAKQVPARYPNLPPDAGPRDGWLFAAAPSEGTDGLGNVQFRFHPGDLPDIAGMAGLAVHIVGGFIPGFQWGSDVLPILSIDDAASTIHTAGTGYFFTGEGSRYFLSGREEFLDAPREWWYDQVARRIRYIPVDAGFGDAAVVAGVLPTFLKIAGANDVAIVGLAFRDGAPEGTGKYGTDTRGGGAIRIENSARVRIEGNGFENVGVAVHVSESPDAVISGNDISHVAGNGIYLGTSYGTFGRSDRARITGNRIRNVGEVFFESAGIWYQAADDVLIAHNRIEDAAQFGIAGGSLWGSEDASHRVLVERNIVRNANRLTADGGAIKMMGAQSEPQDSVIRDNLVVGTDQLMNRADGTFWPPRYENTSEWPGPISWAIYLDGRASGISVTGNRLCGNVAGIGINGGWSNLVSANVILDGSGSAFRVDDATGRGWKPPWARPNRIDGNSVEITRPDGLAVAVHVPDHGSGFVRFSDNLYVGQVTPQSYRFSPAIMPSGEFGSLADFEAAGQDVGARAIAAPMDAGVHDVLESTDIEKDAGRDHYAMNGTLARHECRIGANALKDLVPLR